MKMNKLIMTVAVLAGAYVSRAEFTNGCDLPDPNKTLALRELIAQAVEKENWRECEEYTLKLIDHSGESPHYYINLFLLNWNIGTKARAKDFLKKGIENLRTWQKGCEVYAKELLDKAEADDLPSKFSANDIYSDSCGITHFVMEPLHTALEQERYERKKKMDAENEWLNWIGAYADASTSVYRKQGEMFATQAKFNARREYENKYHSTFDPKDRPSESSGRREDWDSCKKIYDIFGER